MATPARISFKLYQGSTFAEVLRWESPIKGYKPITAITKSAPVVITSASHGIPTGWRILLKNIVGMTELNSADSYNLVTESTSSTITINAINSLDYKAYVSGGIIEYNVPVDLTGYTGRMQLRSDIDSSVVIHELTTANSGVVFDATFKTINLNIPAITTSGFDFTTAVYDLELISSGGQVTQFCGGSITLVREVTR